MQGETIIDEDIVQANDPLYLMKKTSTPEPFSDTPMFQKWGEEDQVFGIEKDGKTHNVTVRISWATPETIPQDGIDRGNKLYGKHAAKNIGVSIIRADREFDLDSSWTIGYDPTERW